MPNIQCETCRYRRLLEEQERGKVRLLTLCALGLSFTKDAEEDKCRSHEVKAKRKRKYLIDDLHRY